MAVATVAGVGYLPLAPGTFGSAVGVLFFGALCHLGLGLYVLTLLALTALAIWASDLADRHFGQPDDGRIVIDEVVGQLWLFTPLVALVPLDFLGLHVSQPVLGGFSIWMASLVTGFVLFRVLDIVKPGPVRWAERRFEGGVGVVADDVVAGGLGAVIFTVLLYAIVVIQLGSRAGFSGRDWLLGVAS